ncbi:CAP domain-containing protein [Halosimplex salinum]|uniref:CAP domain-containing protein n=1 Tax=Halosimplex salinum TaxID=1710538 RepID=UPI0013DE6EDD|nr:CAP domain-containing protein [Halosimplex salinum]
MVDVNRPTLLVAGGGVVALVVVAVLVGAALSQPNAPVTGDDPDVTDVRATDLPTLEPTPEGSATTTPEGGAIDGTPTATPTPYPTLTPTATPTPTPTATPALTDVPVDTFDEHEIERHVGEYLNERRRAVGLSTLSIDGGGVEPIVEMARTHSVDMADAGKAIHRIDGRDSADRYRDNDLYERCRWPAAESDTLVTADDNALEAVGRTVAGEPYYEEGDRKFNGNERAVAESLVDTWWNSSTYNPRLTRQNASRVGVGVDITRRGDVFATADFC